MYFISVLYDDENVETYNGIKLSSMGSEICVINSKNPTIDYLAAFLLIQKLTNFVDNVTVMGSSSVDHFVFDGGDLKTENFSDKEHEESLILAKGIYENIQNKTG